MLGVTFYNKQHLCYIDDTDFTDYQGIGSDPLYKRYESVNSVVTNHIDAKYQSFLARPYYDDGQIHWYVDEWKESPKCFTELKGIEKDKYLQIKNDTIAHYRNVLNKLSSDELLIMAGALKYINDEFIYCFDDKVILIAWGMKPDSSKHVIGGSWVKGLKREEKFKIYFNPDANGKLKYPDRGVINRKKGDRIVTTDIPEVIPNEGFKFEGWSPSDIIGHEVQGETVFTANFRILEAPDEFLKNEEVNVTAHFDAGNGTLSGNSQVSCIKGQKIPIASVPSVIARRGYRFIGWSPSTEISIDHDTYFIAQYEEKTARCTFLAGDHGEMTGQSEWIKPIGSKMLTDEIPSIKQHRGYKFTGWDSSTTDHIQGDRVFTAQYEQVLPCYKSFWIWLTSFGCLKWLLYTLLVILFIWLLSWLLRGCVGCGGHHGGDIFGAPILDNDSVSSTEQIQGSDGEERDNNGTIKAITDGEGNLPETGIIAPIVGEDGAQPPIVHNEGAPDVVGNRLNIYFDNENADLNKWAHEFKKAYPLDEYQIIGYDKNVRMIQIQIPENKRNQIREEINSKIPDQDFFVVDESIITLHGKESSYDDASIHGWHLKATGVKEAWSITTGNSNIVVAIVDDGIDANHGMLKGRFYKAYNVFTQNRTLGLGKGHGTHVAGLAVGSAQYFSHGVAGVAPRCKIMPVQVFDNGVCTFSSIASGIMYAIHNGANVVNISIGPTFPGLDQMPIDQQKQISHAYFKNEEKVYRHIIKTANEKNVILVFAAGNDNILTAILPECRTTSNTVNVAAVNPNFEAADFSNYSLGTNISAPGVEIYSSFINNSFKSFDGTSMAAPIISGAIALMRSINPKLNVGQILGIMQQNGRQIQDGRYVPPMILIDRCLKAIKGGKIPNGPVWNFKDENDAVESTPVVREETDNYASLRDKLNKLKQQRDELNRQINLIEKKLR